MKENTKVAKSNFDFQTKTAQLEHDGEIAKLTTELKNKDIQLNAQKNELSVVKMNLTRAETQLGKFEQINVEGMKELVRTKGIKDRAAIRTTNGRGHLPQEQPEHNVDNNKRPANQCGGPRPTAAGLQRHKWTESNKPSGSEPEPTIDHGGDDT